MKIQSFHIQPVGRAVEPAARAPSQPFEMLLETGGDELESAPDRAFAFLELGMFGKTGSGTVASLAFSTGEIAVEEGPRLGTDGTTAAAAGQLSSSVVRGARDASIAWTSGSANPQDPEAYSGASQGAELRSFEVDVGTPQVADSLSFGAYAGAPLVKPVEAQLLLPAMPAQPPASPPVPASAAMSIAPAGPDPLEEPAAAAAADPPELPDSPSGDQEPLSLAVFESEKMVKLTAFARGLGPAERSKLLAESAALLREHGLGLGQLLLGGATLSPFDPDGDINGPRTN